MNLPTPSAGEFLTGEYPTQLSNTVNPTHALASSDLG